MSDADVCKDKEASVLRKNFELVIKDNKFVFYYAAQKAREDREKKITLVVDIFKLVQRLDDGTSSGAIAVRKMKVLTVWCSESRVEKEGWIL